MDALYTVTSHQICGHFFGVGGNLLTAATQVFDSKRLLHKRPNSELGANVSISPGHSPMTLLSRATSSRPLCARVSNSITSAGFVFAGRCRSPRSRSIDPSRRERLLPNTIGESLYHRGQAGPGDLGQPRGASGYAASLGRIAQLPVARHSLCKQNPTSGGRFSTD